MAVAIKRLTCCNWFAGCRIPKSYFICHGFGETDAGGGVDPWETGSYDLALEAAGIQDFNVRVTPQLHQTCLTMQTCTHAALTHMPAVYHQLVFPYSLDVSHDCV